MALILAGAAVPVALHLRHAGIVLLVLFAPLPGLAAAGAVVLFWLKAAPDLLPYAYLSALTPALLLCDAYVLAVLDGTAPRRAMMSALGSEAAALLIALCAGLMALAAAMLVVPPEAVGAALLLVVGAVASTLALLPIAAVLPFGEEAVARANRMRERGQPIFDRLIAAARPRWGFALAGIALVFAVLAGFGLWPLSAPFESRWALLDGALIVLLAAASGVVARDWRAALAGLLALALCLLLGLWSVRLAHLPLTPQSLLPLLVVFGVAAVPILRAAAETGRYGRSDDDATIAWARLWAKRGTGLFFAAIAPVTALLAQSLGASRPAPPLAALALFSAAAVLLFQPAIAIVIERLVPRRATIEARYRLH